MARVAGQCIPLFQLYRRHVAIGYERQFDQLGEIDVVLVVTGVSRDNGLNFELDLVRTVARCR